MMLFSILVALGLEAVLLLLLICCLKAAQLADVARAVFLSPDRHVDRGTAPASRPLDVESTWHGRGAGLAGWRRPRNRKRHSWIQALAARGSLRRVA